MCVSCTRSLLPPGDNSGSSFSSGAIFGIVFGVAVVIFVLFPLVWVFGKDWWSKRHNYSWYRCLTTPSDWCDCDCFSRSPRRNFELTRPVEEITITHTHIPDAPQVSYHMHVSSVHVHTHTHTHTHMYEHTYTHPDTESARYQL